jgi:hypothetical protein
MPADVASLWRKIPAFWRTITRLLCCIPLQQRAMQLNDTDDDAERIRGTQEQRILDPRPSLATRDDWLFVLSVVSFFGLLAAASWILFWP